jgi:hypothetical protein
MIYEAQSVRSPYIPNSSLLLKFLVDHGLRYFTSRNPMDLVLELKTEEYVQNSSIYTRLPVVRTGINKRPFN